MRRLIKDVLKGGADIYALEARVLKLEAELQASKSGARSASDASEGRTSADSAASFPLPKFWEYSYWEPTVQLCIREYCRPGDVAFDIGANAGALSMLMSRLVGPKGTVCSFEASPRIIDKTVHNLVTAGCFNATVYHRAVFHTSNEMVTLYPGSHLNDSIYNNLGAEGGISFQVETLAIDDFVDATGLVPNFIKMDIEGAEFDALMGMTRLLAAQKPVLVLEQSPSDMRCHTMLTGLGYVAVNLADYVRIASVADFTPGVEILNMLFVHPSVARDDPYLGTTPSEKVVSLDASAFAVGTNGGIEVKTPIRLPPGRYACAAQFTAQGADNEIFAGIETERGVILRYHTYTRLMAESYRDWVFTLDSTSDVKPYLRFLNGSDRTLKWQGAHIRRYPAFDSVKRPVVS